MIAALVLIVAYLLGSVPFSYLVAKRWGVEDVRKVGSGNVGATNVLRSAGRVAGSVAFGLDFLKGCGASLIGLRVAPAGPLPALAAAAAVLGHMYPVWLSFKGGKGVATGAGAFLPLAPLATGAALLTFAITLAATRYVSVGSIAGTTALAALAFLRGAPPGVAWAATGVGLLIVWKHRGNIGRLMKGTEGRVGAVRAP